MQKLDYRMSFDVVSNSAHGPGKSGETNDIIEIMPGDSVAELSTRNVAPVATPLHCDKPDAIDQAQLVVA